MLNKEEIIEHLKANDEKLTEIEWQDINDIDVQKLKEVIIDNTYCRILIIKGQKELSAKGERLLFEIHKRINENNCNYQIKLKTLKEEENSVKDLSINQSSGSEYFQKLLVSTSSTFAIFTNAHPNIHHYVGNRGQSKWTIFKKLDKPEAKKIAEVIKQKTQTNVEIIKIGAAYINNFISPFGGKENHLYIPNKRIINSIAEALLQPDCQLKEIHIQNCKIDYDALKNLFKAIKDNKSLVVLDLSNLSIRDSGATSIPQFIIEKYLIPSLKNNSTLKQMDLTGRNLNKNCVLNLLQVLTKNTSLEVIKVNSYKTYRGKDKLIMTHEGVKFYEENFFKKLVNILENNYNLCELDISKLVYGKCKYAVHYDQDNLIDLAMKECQQILERNKAISQKNSVETPITIRI